MVFPATGNRFLLETILRKEWGFTGMVVSDYESVLEMVKHGTAADPAQAALQAISAGVDMEMVSTTYFDHLANAGEGRQVPMSAIDAAVRNILRLKFQLGLFDNDKALRPPAAVPVTAEGRELTKQLAIESLVLLKNDHATLPLTGAAKRIAVIGPLADSPVDQMGSWVMDAKTRRRRDTPCSTAEEIWGRSNHVMFRF